MTTYVTDEPGALVSFAVQLRRPDEVLNEETQTIYTFHETARGVACNYSQGQEKQFSVRLTGSGFHAVGLSEVDALLLLVGLGEEQGATAEDAEVFSWPDGGEASNDALHASAA